MQDDKKDKEQPGIKKTLLLWALLTLIFFIAIIFAYKARKASPKVRRS